LGQAITSTTGCPASPNKFQGGEEMTDTNEDRLDIDGVENVLENGEGSFPRALARRLIEEVERLREEAESNKFVDEMNELADMMECIDTDGKIVTESGIRNAIKNKITSLTKQKNQLIIANSELVGKNGNLAEELEAWKAKPSRATISFLLEQHDEKIKKLEAENAELKKSCGYYEAKLKLCDAVLSESQMDLIRNELRKL
jgi:hypothetical protein